MYRSKNYSIFYYITGGHLLYTPYHNPGTLFCHYDYHDVTHPYTGSDIFRILLMIIMDESLVNLW